MGGVLFAFLLTKHHPTRAPLEPALENFSQAPGLKLFARRRLHWRGLHRYDTAVWHGLQLRSLRPRERPRRGLVAGWRCVRSWGSHPGPKAARFLDLGFCSLAQGGKQHKQLGSAGGNFLTPQARGSGGIAGELMRFAEFLVLCFRMCISPKV